MNLLLKVAVIWPLKLSWQLLTFLFVKVGQPSGRALARAAHTRRFWTLVVAAAGLAGSTVLVSYLLQSWTGRFVMFVAVVMTFSFGWIYLKGDHPLITAARRYRKRHIRPIAWLRGEERRDVEDLNEAGAKLGEFEADFADLKVGKDECLQPGRVPIGTVHVRKFRKAPKLPVLLANEPMRHMLINAPSQSGKTSSILIPALLSSGLTGCCVLTSDPKGELLELTMPYRANAGVVTAWDPANALDGALVTQRWSLTQYLRRATDPHDLYDRALSQANALADGLRVGNTSDTDFFSTMAEQLLAPVLVAAAFEETRGLPDVIRWIGSSGNDGATNDEVRGILETYGNAGGDRQVLVDWELFEHMEDRQRQSIYSTASTLVKSFKSPSVRASADLDTGPAFDAKEFLKRPGTHYLVADEMKMRQLRGLFMAHINEVLMEARMLAKSSPGKKLPYPLVVVLEEAASMGCLRDLPTALAVDAGRNIFYVVVLQNFEQGIDIWGERGFQNMLTNLHCKIFLRGEQGPAANEWLANQGAVRVERKSTSHDEDGKKSGTNTSVSDERLVGGHVLKRLPLGKGLLSYTGVPLTQLEVDTYKNQAHLMRRVIEPEVSWEAEAAAGRVNLPSAATRECPESAGSETPRWLSATWAAVSEERKAARERAEAEALETIAAAAARIAERDEAVSGPAGARQGGHAAPQAQKRKRSFRSQTAAPVVSEAQTASDEWVPVDEMPSWNGEQDDLFSDSFGASGFDGLTVDPVTGELLG